jgi:hypothetical protein
MMAEYGLIFATRRNGRALIKRRAVRRVKLQAFIKSSKQAKVTHAQI